MNREFTPQNPGRDAGFIDAEHIFRTGEDSLERVAPDVLESLDADASQASFGGLRRRIIQPNARYYPRPDSNKGGVDSQPSTSSL